jgi:hypothetical protein
MKIFAVFPLVAVFSAQGFNLECRFRLSGGSYGCFIEGVTVSNNENMNIVITGSHLEGFNDLDVQDISITDSSIPFIIRQLFTTFPNASSFILTRSGLTRITAGDFTNARNLRFVTARYNPNFCSIEANAFSGASSISNIDLSTNGIETIAAGAFIGLSTVRALTLDNNRISELPATLLESLTNLNTFGARNNTLQRLDGRLFANSRLVFSIHFSLNQIDSIQSSFLDGLNSLRNLNLNNNRCVSYNFIIDGAGVTLDRVRRDLNLCFENFVETPEPEEELRRFVIEVRGPLSLRFENGTEIVRV